MLMSLAWRGLHEAGIDVVPVDARHIELRHDGHRAQLALRTSTRPLNPSDVTTFVDREPAPGLLVLPTATAEVRDTAERAGWSWLVVGPVGVRGVVYFGHHEVRIGDQPAEPAPSPRGRSGPVPWGSLTLVRRLLQQPAATQKVLAALVGVSQPRVSQALGALADRRLVARGGTGWVVRDFDGLVQHWLDSYPGPGGIATHWYGLEPPRSQAQAVIQLLTRQPVRDRRSVDGGRVTVVSGDVAADIVAAWRSPVRAVVYARRGADLADVGLTPSGPDEATLELIVPQDPGVWPPVAAPVPGVPGRRGAGSARSAQPPMPIADLLQVLWDVRRAPGSDSGEAAARVWELLRDRCRTAQPGGAA